MNLQETVSKILNKEVTLSDAKEFANDNFGILSAFLKHDMVKKPSQERIDEVKTMIIENYVLHENTDVTLQDKENIDLYVKEDHVDEIRQSFF